MDNKIYSESFIEHILPTKYLYGRNQCQVQFYEPFSSLQLNWDMNCCGNGLLIEKLINLEVTLICFSLFCIFVLREISEVSSTFE